MKLVAVGDLSLNGHFERTLESQGELFPFAALHHEWANADVTIGNLESPITSAPRLAPSKVVLRGAPQTAESLVAAGFDYVSLANNHVMDFGPEGAENTMEKLERSGVLFGGVGVGQAAAVKPVILTKAGIKIGFVSGCDVQQRSHLFATSDQIGVANLHSPEFLNSIGEMRNNVDRLVVMLHWGQELSQLPSPEQRAFARRLVGLGVDLIVGHHPHVLQPVECIDGVPVAYSLGNFLFSDMFWRGTKPCGEKFWSKLRLHPLSRWTGWLECQFEKTGPIDFQIRLARLSKRGQVIPTNSEADQSNWEYLTTKLNSDYYQKEFENEEVRANDRHYWRWGRSTFMRRLELYAFRLGLIGREAEGFN